MSDRTMFIAVAFERHCKEHLNADFEVCKDEICQVAVEFEQAAQHRVQADGLCPNCGRDYFENETIVDGELRCSCARR